MRILLTLLALAAGGCGVPDEMQSPRMKAVAAACKSQGGAAFVNRPSLVADHVQINCVLPLLAETMEGR